MNPFSAHPNQQGISYTEHLLFAMGIAIRLFRSVFAFAAHGIFPFIDIRPSLDLEATMKFLEKENDWIENMKTATPSITKQHTLRGLSQSEHIL
jgi:type 1 glutamine amidotransferase